MMAGWLTRSANKIFVQYFFRGAVFEVAYLDSRKKASVLALLFLLVEAGQSHDIEKMSYPPMGKLILFKSSGSLAAAQWSDECRGLIIGVKLKQMTNEVTLTPMLAMLL